MHDVIIIGAGPSGMMCAISASLKGKKVVLLEKNEDVGKKMKLTGGGRCNITNLKTNSDFIKNLPLKNGRFLYSSLTNFGPNEIYQYFESLGVPLKIEKDDKVFPVSNKSLDFIETLKKELLRLNATLLTNTEVLNIEIKGDEKIVETTSGIFKAPNVVLATGGKSYPHTGSTGFGHEIAEKFNHSITELFPTESPILSHDPIIIGKQLQGLSFEDVKLSLINENGKEIMSHTNDLIITHFGLSGPCALKLSQFIYHYLKEHKEALLNLDIKPQDSYESIVSFLKEKRQTNPKSLFKNVIKDLGPNRFLNFIYEQIYLNNEIMCGEINNKQIDQFVRLIKNFPIKAHEIKPIQVAFVTGGGVSIKDIDPKTMESKLLKGLYFIGEVLDLHGYTGGYNVTIALSTGYTAGLHIQ